MPAVLCLPHFLQGISDRWLLCRNKGGLGQTFCLAVAQAPDRNCFEPAAEAAPFFVQLEVADRADDFREDVLNEVVGVGRGKPEPPRDAAQNGR